MLLAILLACTEVGLVKYKNNPTDTNDTTVIDTSVSPQPEAQPSTSPNPGPEGIGGYFSYYARQVACPACVGEPQEISITLHAEFHDPTNQSHTEWVVPQGECTENLTFTNPSVQSINVGPNINVINNFREIVMAKVGDDYDAGIYETQYDRDTEHEVNTQEGSFKFRSFHGFDSITPQELLYTDPSYAFAAPINRNGTNFWWSPSGTNSTFMVTIAVYSYDGAQLLGYVACATGDNGMITIPGQYLSRYPSNSLVAVHLARHKIENVLWEDRNTFVETHMEHEVIGTGYIQ